MLISKEIEVKIGNNISYYESRGYNIPKYLDKKGRFKVKKDTKILVKVQDLSKGTETKVLRRCDKCGIEDWVRFNQYKDFCKKCATIKSNVKRNIKDVVKIFEDNGCKLLSKEYKNNYTKLDFICICGRKSKISLNSFLSGHIRCFDCGRKSTSRKLSGKNAPWYNHHKTDEERFLQRKYPEYIHWRKLVYERDKYTCQCCKKNGIVLNAHHIENYSNNIELRLKIDNGITMCKDCHNEFHKKFGKRNNNSHQLDEFIGFINEQPKT